MRRRSGSVGGPGWATTPVYPAVAGRESAPWGPMWSPAGSGTRSPSHR